MSNQSRGRTGGVLPINAVATKKTNAPQKPAQRSPAPRLRLIIRRLPPGLSETELWDALGSEWQTGNGKVTWHAFKEGKISKDPSKPSRPGRVYMKVKDQSLLDSLSAQVKATSFRDAKNTTNDPCLVGPPSLEFAPYSKVPSGRNRHDGRQGTIDQDQEFIDFLQSLTEPITKPAANGVEAADTKTEKIMTTPLVQFIKEKKANKAKEKEAAAAAKSSKKNQEGKEGKGKEPRPTVVVKSNVAAADKAKVAKATQEAVKAANKSAVQVQSKASVSKTEPKPTEETSAPATPTSSATPSSAASVQKPERQRGSASAASRMIARDLGLAPKEPRTPRAARNVSAATSATAESTSKTGAQTKVASPAPTATSKVGTAPAPASTTTSTSAPSPAPASTTASAPTPPTGPKNNRSNQTPQTKPAQPVAQRQSKQSAQPTAGAKSAFLKHANPSQGVTEELLRTTFSTYGEVTRCEIDKKKGLGYVDFTDTEALKKAMAASPIKVGNGQVVVLENKSPYHKRQAQPGNAVQQQTGAVKSNSRAASVTSSAVASAVTSPQPVHATVAKTEPAAIATAIPTINTTTEPTSSTEPASTSGSQPPTPSTPTAPKGGKGGNAANRGARGGTAATPGRGSFNQSPNRGRGGFRGRGGRGNRAGANAGATAGSSSPSSTPAASGTQGNDGEGTKPTPAEKAPAQS